MNQNEFFEMWKNWDEYQRKETKKIRRKINRNLFWFRIKRMFWGKEGK